MGPLADDAGGRKSGVRPPKPAGTEPPPGGDGHFVLGPG